MIPLSLDGSGSVGRPIEFNGITFPAGTPLETFYRFNSYRLTYRYGIKSSGKLRLGLGLTAFVRDAAIRLTGGGLDSENANVGPKMSSWLSSTRKATESPLRQATDSSREALTTRKSTILRSSIFLRWA